MGQSDSEEGWQGERPSFLGPVQCLAHSGSSGRAGECLNAVGRGRLLQRSTHESLKGTVLGEMKGKDGPIGRICTGVPHPQEIVWVKRPP